MNRDGKVVFRPDSGDPVKIITGLLPEEITQKDTDSEMKGAIEVLYEIFGGSINEKGYKELDPHVGLIYGDSITLDRFEQILERLEKKGFASTNIVVGVGSFTYQYNTRDSLGLAMKSTYGEVNGVARNIYKDPKTGTGFKKSAKGLVKVFKDESNEFTLVDQVTMKEFNSSDNELKIIFENGKMINETSLKEIRETLKKS